MFGLDVLGDILLVGMGQFRNQRRKKERIAAENYEDFKSNSNKTYGQVDSEAFPEQGVTARGGHAEEGVAPPSCGHVQKASHGGLGNEKHGCIEAKKAEVVAARSSVMKKLASIHTASVVQYKKVCDASMQFGQQRSRRGAFQMFASQAIVLSQLRPTVILLASLPRLLTGMHESPP